MDDGVVRPELGGRRVVPDDTLLHDVDAARGLERQRHVLLDEQDGNALLGAARR